MHILWINNTAYPEKNGTKEDVVRSVAETAIYEGRAKALPRPAYGTPEWIAQRRAVDDGRKIQPGETAAPFVEGTKWGIQNHALSGVVLVRESGSEVARFKDADTAEHYGAPKELCKELTRLIKEQVKKNIEAERIEAGNSWGSNGVHFI